MKYYTLIVTIICLLFMSNNTLLCVNNNPYPSTYNNNAFYEKATSYLSDNNYNLLISYCLEQIAIEEKAVFYQFLGVGYLLKYEDSTISFFWNNSFEDAIVAFEKAKDIDNTFEDKAIAGIVTAYLMSEDYDTAYDLFEKTFNKYPNSIYLNFTGIKIYEEKGETTKKMMCESFMKENDPTYDGKPVCTSFVVIKLGYSLKTLIAFYLITNTVSVLTTRKYMNNLNRYQNE